jgi:hypothetical protein
VVPLVARLPSSFLARRHRLRERAALSVAVEEGGQQADGVANARLGHGALARERALGPDAHDLVSCRDHPSVAGASVASADKTRAHGRPPARRRPERHGPTRDRRLQDADQHSLSSSFALQPTAARRQRTGDRRQPTGCGSTPDGGGCSSRSCASRFLWRRCARDRRAGRPSCRPAFQVRGVA